MRQNSRAPRFLRPVVGVVGFVVVGVLAIGCSDDEPQEGAPSTAADTGGDDLIERPENDHLENIGTLAELLPADTSGVVALDLATIMSGDSAESVGALLRGDGADPVLGEPFGAVRRLAASIDVPRTVTTALLVHTTDATDGRLLLASTQVETIDQLSAASMPTSEGTYGPASTAVYSDANGNHVALLSGGSLIIGKKSVVESVLDVAAAPDLEDPHPISPFLDVLESGSHVSFVYGLPALFDATVTPDLTFSTAALMSGALDLAGSEIAGHVSFHTSNAAEFVETYNSLNRHAVQAEGSSELPLTLVDPDDHGLGQVVVALPPTAIDGSGQDVTESHNIFKKLFVGMEAADYAEGVADRSNAAWLDFIVKSDTGTGATPPASSVYIRWEFRDQAAIDAFEANELPAGFRLAPTRFLESDDPDGEYFLALNLYDAGGGSIVSGARAEWDVFVHGPPGADPNAGDRPRFMVVEALAEEVSADPGNLLTAAEPLSHELIDGVVVSSVSRFEDGREVPVFESSFPRPDPASADVARFTREMAIGNDYIYWEHGVSDRVLYNATTFNHDAYFVDTTQLTFTDDSPWAQYLKPAVKDAVYYVNTLEYVASPMANLESDHLDITPEWLSELVGFTTNGHQEGLMRKAVEQLFRGEGDALVGQRVVNETPSTHVNFEITDPDALAAELDLPAGSTLARIQLFEGAAEGYYLTLSVKEFEDATEGTRAEWSVYVDDGSGRPNMLVLDLMTAEMGTDPVNLINLPSVVRHELVDGVVTTSLSSGDIEFEASFETAGAAEETLSLDWIEAGDNVCYANGICDKFYYDAETLDVSVDRPAGVTVTAFSAPWIDLLSAEPTSVFHRDNAQEYVVNRWHNLEVPIEELPFSGLEDRTHIISGSGNLVGRDSNVADSEYSYTGDAILDGDQLTFSIDQQVDNALGIGNIFTTGSIDLATGTGTQSVVDCQGPALLCSGIEIGSTAFYVAGDLDASDRDDISWRVDVTIDLGGSFGIADSASALNVQREV